MTFSKKTLAVGLLTLMISACRPQPGPQTNAGANSNTLPTPTPVAVAKRGTSGWELDNGQHVSLADYKGKVLVLDFYATWCGPCREETPHLVALQKKYGDQGLQIVGLNVGGDDDREKVPAYAREFGIQFPLGFPDDELVDEYLGDDQSIPQCFLLNRNGRLVKRFVGYSDADPQQLEAAIQLSLATKK